MKLTTKHYLIGGAVLVGAYLWWKHSQTTTTAATTSTPVVSVGSTSTVSNIPSNQTVPITMASGS